MTQEIVQECGCRAAPSRYFIVDVPRYCFYFGKKFAWACSLNLFVMNSSSRCRERAVHNNRKANGVETETNIKWVLCRVAITIRRANRLRTGCCRGPVYWIVSDLRWRVLDDGADQPLKLGAQAEDENDPCHYTTHFHFLQIIQRNFSFFTLFALVASFKLTLQSLVM